MGVGGTFFDQLRASDSMTKEQVFSFVSIVLSEAVQFRYIIRAILTNENANKWQLSRRSRYVEFKLHDRKLKSTREGQSLF